MLAERAACLFAGRPDGPRVVMVMVVCRSSEQMDWKVAIVYFFRDVSVFVGECNVDRRTLLLLMVHARRGGMERGTVSAGSVGSRQVKAKTGG